MQQPSVWEACIEKDRNMRRTKRYGDMLLDWMEGAVDAAAGRATARLTTAEWPRARLAARQHLRCSLGLDPLPARTTGLDARLVGKIEYDDYEIERLVLETRPNFLMPVHLYVPKGLKAPAPAILYSPGHWMINGKTEPDIQACCISFAKLGFVVLAFDPIGQGERGATFEDHARRELLLLGLSQEGLMAWESIRAIDYLLTRPEVDGNRIGMTGASGGGLNTIYTCAADERIAVSVPVCYVVSFGRFYRAMRGLNWNNQNDLCNQVPNVIRDFDMAGLCGLIYPRPLMFINGTLDPQFPVDGAQQVEAQLREIYDQVGGERLRATAVVSDHGYVQVMREAAYGWFRKWLQGEGEGDPYPEPALVVEEADAAALKCFPGAPEIRSGPAIRDLARSRAKNLAAEGFVSPADLSQDDWRAWSTTLQDKLAECLGVERHVSAPTGQRESVAGGAEYHVLTPEPGILLPAFVFAPPARERGQTVVYCCDEGKLAGLGVEFLSEATKRGAAVLAVDPRGFGETAPAPPPVQTVATLDGKLIYRPTGEEDTLEFEAATNALMLGRSLLGQQVSDLIAAIRYAKQLERGAAIHLVGSGPIAALLALYAGVLCDDVSTVTTDRLLPSYRLLVEEDEQLFPITAYVFDILRVADIPQTAALFAPRRLIVTRAIGARRQPLSVPDIRHTLAWTTAACETRGCPPPAIFDQMPAAELAELVVQSDM